MGIVIKQAKSGLVKTLEGQGLITRPAAAHYLSVSTKTIDRWADRGILERRILGPRCVRITTASLEKVTKRKNRK